MNQCIVDLFTDRKKAETLVRGLPVAFEMARLELPGRNPAVGFLREHAITGFFVHLFGKEQVGLPERGNTRGFDVTVCGKQISIKTVTGKGGVKVVWTVDDSRVKKEIGSNYTPDCDMFLTRIYWGEDKPSIFYIPLHVQKKIYAEIGRDKYLTAATGTNHRGISVRSAAMTKLMNDCDTMKLNVHWIESGLDYTPYARWEEFWENQSGKK